MLIDYTYFSNPLTRIAGIDQRSDGKPTAYAQGLREDVEAYIRLYEPQFTRMLLGPVLAQKIDQRSDIAALLANPTDRSSVIADYVYYRYLTDHSTFNTIAGEKIKTSEYSKNSSPQHRLITLWNNMVDRCHAIVFSLCDQDLCPDFDSEIFSKVNRFGL